MTIERIGCKLVGRIPLERYSANRIFTATSPEWSKGGPEHKGKREKRGKVAFRKFLILEVKVCLWGCNEAGVGGCVEGVSSPVKCNLLSSYLKRLPPGKRTAISSAQLRQSEVWRLRSAKFRVHTYFVCVLRCTPIRPTARTFERRNLRFTSDTPISSSFTRASLYYNSRRSNFSGILIKSALRKDTFDVPDIHRSNVY